MNNLNPIYLILEAQNAASKKIGKELAEFISKRRDISQSGKNIANAFLNAKNHSKVNDAVTKGLGHYIKGGVAASDAIASATKGAGLLTKGQKAVGKGRKTLKGKIKQHIENAKTVYSKIHS